MHAEPQKFTLRCLWARVWCGLCLTGGKYSFGWISVGWTEYCIAASGSGHAGTERDLRYTSAGERAHIYTRRDGRRDYRFTHLFCHNRHVQTYLSLFDGDKSVHCLAPRCSIRFHPCAWTQFFAKHLHSNPWKIEAIMWMSSQMLTSGRCLLWADAHIPHAGYTWSEIISSFHEFHDF